MFDMLRSNKKRDCPKMSRVRTKDKDKWLKSVEDREVRQFHNLNYKEVSEDSDIRHVEIK